MFVVPIWAILGLLVFSVSTHNLRIVLGARLFSDSKEVCTSFIRNLDMKIIKWVRLDEGLRNVLLTKGQFTNYVSHIWGSLDPPSPLVSDCQQLAYTPPPPL